MRAVRAAALLVVVVLLTGACTNSPESQTDETSTTDETGTTDQTGSTEALRTTVPAAEAGTPSAHASSRSGPPIATRDVSIEETTLRIEITELRREGRLATLSWTVTNIGDSIWQMGSTMGDSAPLDLTVAGVSLVDTRNAKRYRVARSHSEDGTGCLCSARDTNTYPGESLPLYATFTAPPPEVTSVTVELQVLGIFNDVPIS